MDKLRSAFHRFFKDFIFQVVKKTCEFEFCNRTSFSSKRCLSLLAKLRHKATDLDAKFDSFEGFFRLNFF